MNPFQSCKNTADAVPLYLPQNLYLKPVAAINISIQLSQQIEPGTSISNWEIMEKLKSMIKPEEFSMLRASKCTLDVMRFESEIEDRSKLIKVIALLDGKTIKVNTISQLLKIRAAEAKSDFPNRHAWDSFFRDAKNMNEMNPGERPDTVHITNLPIKWFVPPLTDDLGDTKPSTKIFQKVFEKFGHIRQIDIPVCDLYRSHMKEHMSGFKTFTHDRGTFFEGYVQFKDYIGFVRTMDAFRGMKLLRKEEKESFCVNIKVDFDKSKHLSDSSVRRRRIVRDRLVSKEKEQEEQMKEEQVQKDKVEQEKRQKEIDQKLAKEQRQREREEKRKARHFAELKLKESEELKKKIEKEEKKLFKAQRKLQAIRLVEELFIRIKAKVEKDKVNKSSIHSSKNDDISKLKITRERQVAEQKEKLNKALTGRVVLDSILGKEKHSSSSSESSSDSDSSKCKHKRKKKKKKHKKEKKPKKKKHEKSPKKEDLTNSAPADNPYSIYEPNWFGFGPPNNMYPFPHVFGPTMRGGPSFLPYNPRGRGMPQNGVPGPSRGFNSRRRGTYNPHWTRGWRGRRGSLLPHYTAELEKEYYKYFRKFLNEEKNSQSSSRSYSRSRSESRSRSRSYSRSRSRKRSRSSRRRSYSRSRSRSRRRRSSRSTSRSTKTRSKSRSRNKSKSHTPKRSNKSRSPSYKSIDSSKFISPNRLRSKRSRSKSWSLPRSNKEKKRSSWSKSPSPKK